MIEISDEEFKEINLRQKYSCMQTDYLVNKLIKAHKLLDKIKYSLDYENYQPLQKEINNF